jgi:hypothetical protein
MEFFLLLKFILSLWHKDEADWKQLSTEDIEFLWLSLKSSFEKSEIDIAKINRPWGLSSQDLEIFRIPPLGGKPLEIIISKEKIVKSPVLADQVFKALLRCYEWAREKDREKMLVDAYVKKEHPLHIRRTLDQSYYYMLDNTRSRDRDQVVSRYGVKWKRKEPIVIMVDQLWLWVLEGNRRATIPNKHC